ncbi:MAG: hypothetical protein HYR84_10760 [Planctomycetes bacterium]|nr:hypothetical protein [Planctomycetota bacterium]
MKLLTFEIPDDPALVPAWLEGHLMGLDLQQVVMELGALGGAVDGPNLELQDVLGDKAAEVLQIGLRSLSRDQLRRLLKCPQLLLELQRLVLDEGGEYWTTVPEAADAQENTRKTSDKVRAAMRGDGPKSEIARPGLSFRHPWIWSSAGWLVAAAAVLFAFFVPGAQVRQLENRLAEQTAKANDLVAKLNEQQGLARVRFDPAELPDSEGALVAASADPLDLPPDDPEDLPQIQ